METAERMLGGKLDRKRSKIEDGYQGPEGETGPRTMLYKGGENSSGSETSAVGVSKEEPQGGQQKLEGKASSAKGLKTGFFSKTLKAADPGYIHPGGEVCNSSWQLPTSC